MKKIPVKLIDIYDTLLKTYGPQHWWPGDTPWEICTGALLTQNTNWGNVEKAIANLKRMDMLEPHRIFEMPSNELAEAIKPSGYYNIKTVRLKNVARWWLENIHNDKFIKVLSLEKYRESILSVKGVGPETADSILLYSFNLPSFVIDAYTRRIMARHFGSPEDIDYHELREFFMRNLPPDSKLFNEFHALFVRMAKDDCRKAGCSSYCPLCGLSLKRI